MAAAGSNRQSAPDARKPLPGGGASFHFVFPSDFARGREVQSRLLDEVAHCGYPSDSTFGIKLALEEALVNAIKHGNKLDLNKKVRIDSTITPVQVEIVIEDEGPGFVRSSVPDPTEPENLEKCSGRGILLIEAYMTSVSWSHGGRRVHMIKKND